ncbi:MAG: zinc ribbon domain-containing protein [Planctomycetes bacterium]|nr:zinc ribbon domain-containing protein [Planctomycetota bacterium]
MPTYEYTCDACEHHWELFQKMGSAAVKTCPACKARKARRLIGAGAGILFKGSGFYETDYRSESYHQEKKAETETSTTSSKSAKDDAASTTKTSSEPKSTSKSSARKKAARKS